MCIMNKITKRVPITDTTVISGLHQISDQISIRCKPSLFVIIMNKLKTNTKSPV